MTPFQPPVFDPLFRNGHLATIMANFWPRPKLDLRWPVIDVFYPAEPGMECGVDIWIQTQRPPEPKAEVILAHGLEGSSESGYMLSMACALVGDGYAVHRCNMRGCGPASQQPRRWHRDHNYHSGQTGDLRSFARHLKSASGLPIYLVGFSLGGNVVLKLAGELGEEGGELLAGVCSVCAPIDLAACVRKTMEPGNIFYERRFVSRLKERVHARNPEAPDLFPMEHLPKIHTIWDFDDYYTARIFGFGTAENYYRTQSSNQFLNAIRIPTLAIYAEDDPMIPSSMYDLAVFDSNPYLQRIRVPHGGHLGFLACNGPRFWLDAALLSWLSEFGNESQRERVS